MLLHFIDVSGQEGRDPVQDYETINAELKKYSEKLASRKQIIVASKSDVMQDEENFNKLKELAKKNNQEIFKISGATGEGVEELMNHVSQVLKTLPKEQLVEIETNKEKVYTLDSKEDNEFKIVKEDNHTFVVTGEAVDRIMRRVNIADNESLFYLHRKLDEIGLNQALKKAGVKDGDNVKIAQYEMIWED